MDYIVKGTKITLVFDVVKDKTPPNIVRLKKISEQKTLREKTCLGKKKSYDNGFSIYANDINNIILYYKTVIYEALGNDFNLAVLCRNIKQGSESEWKDLSDRTDLANFNLKNGGRFRTGLA